MKLWMFIVGYLLAIVFLIIDTETNKVYTNTKEKTTEYVILLFWPIVFFLGLFFIIYDFIKNKFLF